LKFHSALIYVTDFEEAKTFYCDTLGATLVSEDHLRLAIQLGQLDIDLFLVDGSADASKYAMRPGIALAFQVDDVGEEMTRLKAKGVPFIHSEPNHNAYYRYAAFSDPSGNVIEIAQTL
jgi:glyoxylase I family protein